MSFSHHVIIFEEYFLPQEDFKCIYIQFIFEFFKKTIFLAKNGKIFFRGKHPKYNEFITIGEFPKNSSIDFSFQSEKKNSTEKPYIWILIKKFFPQKFLKMPNW